MGVVEDLSDLTWDQIEDIERLTMRWLFQAVRDFGFDAYEIFHSSPDDVRDVAEDITRELLDRLQGYNISQRVLGTVDYKKAKYVILPDHIARQALFVDSKAEKDNRTATIQMSQTSMAVRQFRAGEAIEAHGELPPICFYGADQFLTTTAILHYCYEDVEAKHHLHQITICCVPNGLLQDRYNPGPHDTIWLVGRNAPSRGEVFRARLSFTRLKGKCAWRVQQV